MKILLLLCLAANFCGFTLSEKNNSSCPVASFSMDPELFKEYVGTYTFTGDSPLNIFIITVKDNDLYGEADSYGANKLLKQSDPDKFLSTSSYGSTIIFLRDKNSKKVTGLQLIIQGTTLEATKNK